VALEPGSRRRALPVEWLVWSTLRASTRARQYASRDAEKKMLSWTRWVPSPRDFLATSLRQNRPILAHAGTRGQSKRT
jgi:hypothetical protein